MKMNFKIIREGNAFYETDDECMQKKEQKSTNLYNSNSLKNTTSRKQNSSSYYIRSSK